MRAVNPFARREAGIALLTTLLLLLLMSSLLVGFIILVMSGQRLTGANNDQHKAFYAAEAGMEKMTADLGTLFEQTYSPSATQVNSITTAAPSLNGITFFAPTAATGGVASVCGSTTSTMHTSGNPGYEITYPVDNSGNPAACSTTIKSGAFQGMNALATPYTLTVSAHTTAGSEVKLMRTTQTVGIPAFQFGVFSDVDLGFHAGPDFNFGGRVHTNGNLYLAEGGGSTLTMADRVTAFKNVIRTYVMNGQSLAAGGWTGTVNITTSPGTSSYRSLKSAPNESSLVDQGSLAATLAAATPNPSWITISTGASPLDYAGNLRNGATGVRRLNLAVTVLGAGTTQPIDIIRRPLQNELAAITGERYFAQASLKVLLSDDPQDIMSLPCIDNTVQPFKLDDIAQPVSLWSSANAESLKTKMGTTGAKPLPLAASGAAGAAYNSTDGYWFPNGRPLIQGYIKIEAQFQPYGSPCGTWKDVTLEVLSYGYAGRNLNPQSGTNTGQTSTTLPGLPGAQLAAIPWANPPVNTQICKDPHPNAIIRLERIRDNPSSITLGSGKSPAVITPAAACAVDPVTGAVQTTDTTQRPGWFDVGTDFLLPTDFWPNALFDPREGDPRDTSPTGNLGGINYSQMVKLGGVMNYIEVDANNLARWFTGAIGSTGPSTKDPVVAPNNFVLYVSDRRQNYTANPLGVPWPPLSPSNHETGEYGFSDFINRTDAANGCPNGTLDPGEDNDGTNKLYTYGQDPTHALGNYGASNYGQMGPLPGAGGSTGLGGGAGSTTANALAPNPNCAVTAPSTLWPGTNVVHANEARQNPNFFFRRAIKIVNGKTLNLGICPGTVACGLTIATENPAYVQGDFNSPVLPWTGVRATDLDISTSVAADTITFLSNAFNDVNTFSSPFSQNLRNAVTSNYRTAALAGKGIGFPWITGTNNDTGSDGGVHNFLRYIENWGGQQLNYRGSIVNLFYNRQATGIYKCCNVVYSPPTRGYNFDVEFLTPSLLPPRTPMFRDVNTTGFSQLILANQ